MHGTLALWYARITPTNPREVRTVEEVPAVELHLNLWRDMPSSMNALDFGMQVTNFDAISRFYLYIPGSIMQEHVRDLAPILKVGPTLNAVFNDVVDLVGESHDSYNISLGGKASMSVFFVSSEDVSIEPFAIEGEQTVGSIIVFSEALCSRIRESSFPTAYIRIRIDLIGSTADLFSSEVVAGDRFFASAIGRLELTELRLNERRNYPSQISKFPGRSEFNITTIHYFLVRDLQHRLVIQHAPFRKVRRLEHNLWADYLANDATSRQNGIAETLASRLVIYHWRQSADPGSGLNNFIAFASFSASSPSILLYAVAVILLGAVGSALAAGLVAVVNEYTPVERVLAVICNGQSICTTATSNLTLVGLLLVTVLVLIKIVDTRGRS